MATQSFLKAVTLRGEKEAKAFIKAVERSKEYEEKQTAHYERQKARDMDREMIKAVFCKNAEAKQ